MRNFSILNAEDIATFKKMYIALYNKSVNAGVPDNERTEFIRNIMDRIFHESIDETINKGYTFSDDEIKNMYNDFYKLIVSLEKEYTNNYS